MKSVVFVVFLASVAMVLRWSKADNPYCPDAGVKANAAFKNLLGDGKEINWKVKVKGDCIKDMIKNAERKDQDVKVVYHEDKVCYAVGEKDLSVWMLSKTDEVDKATKELQGKTKDCADKKPYQALYLPQEDNKNTYMILNPEMAVLFFTSKLGGCDVFIAKNPNKPNQPLVVHSNKNEFKDDAAKNLKLKGDDVDKILQGNANYKVLVRVYRKPDKPATQEVLGNYKKSHNQAEMVEYSIAKKVQFFNFFGIFENNGWKFFLKGEVDGKIIWRKCLNQQGSSCTIL